MLYFLGIIRVIPRDVAPTALSRGKLRIANFCTKYSFLLMILRQTDGDAVMAEPHETIFRIRLADARNLHAGLRTPQHDVGGPEAGYDPARRLPSHPTSGGGVGRPAGRQAIPPIDPDRRRRMADAHRRSGSAGCQADRSDHPPVRRGPRSAAQDRPRRFSVRPIRAGDDETADT